MKIDQSIMKAIYDMLRQMPVLRQVGYPPSDEVEFEILPMSDKVMASYTPDPDVIGICPGRHRFLTSVIKSMIHEMIHMANHMHGSSYLRHDKNFDSIRKQIADALGFDENEI